MISAQPIVVDSVPASRALQRVLLVDESRLQRRILSASLNRDGFEVLEAGSAQEALDICQRDMPDLVLSDWVLSDMEGPEFCRNFRDLPSPHYCYFVFLTAKSEKDSVVKALEQGADDFLLKPVDAHELRARMSAAARILKMQREITDTLSELQTVHELVNKDLLAAKRFQESLVKERVVEFPKGRVSMLLESSGHVGGDLVGHYRIDRDRIGLFAIDVSGHGISSALMTARLAGYLSATSREQNIALIPANGEGYDALPPHQVVEQLNSLFLDEIETEHYFTMVLAEVDLESGKVRLAQAGHPHPLVQRSCGAIEKHGAGGLPVGLVPGADYAEFELTLGPGDRLIVLSDGPIECPDAEGNMLDDDGLNLLLTELAQDQGEDFLEGFLWRLQEFAGGRPIPDDVSGILLEFHDLRNAPSR
ncbi:PP2C family protein-serine/threonine phosphatase [Cognatishimia activa]|uniref:Phosphoserine phosphatase RsbP n=1 Tax=Cognatishimia activa TaxID=1715691 RepID=A0A0P1ILT6_9RHOB|nr:response regulator [Cognatishimia activa]CUI42190.1 Phosphoserine phosphatase RsbP [Cognatishimia activa]CUK24596.1 Phosphoserine phosphatase RsbP [Cognatishimia activa]